MTDHASGFLPTPYPPFNFISHNQTVASLDRNILSGTLVATYLLEQNMGNVVLFANNITS